MYNGFHFLPGEFSYTDVDMKDLLQKAEALVTDELPEGWQEVKDGSEIYYWHIWTGTIQYERPVLSTVSILLFCMKHVQRQ